MLDTFVEGMFKLPELLHGDSSFVVVGVWFIGVMLVFVLRWESGVVERIRPSGCYGDDGR